MLDKASPLSLGLMKLLTEKLKYLQASSFEMTRNIARADIAGMRRMELKPFAQTLKKTHQGMTSDLTNAQVNTGEMISRETESLALGQITMEYQALINIYRRYHDMVRLVIGKG